MHQLFQVLHTKGQLNQANGKKKIIWKGNRMVKWKTVNDFEDWLLEEVDVGIILSRRVLAVFFSGPCLNHFSPALTVGARLPCVSQGKLISVAFCQPLWAPEITFNTIFVSKWRVAPE